MFNVHIFLLSQDLCCCFGLEVFKRTREILLKFSFTCSYTEILKQSKIKIYKALHFYLFYFP